MEIVLQLSKQDLELAYAEASALYAVERLRDDLLLAKGDPKHLKRLVLTKSAGKLLHDTRSFDKLTFPAYKSFAIRISDLTGHADANGIIKALAKRIKGKVDLRVPETVIRVFTDGERHWVTEQLYEFDAHTLAARDVNARLVFSPTSLQPKFARLLINLSGVKRGKILDPFCGVGGLLLEAADFGLRAQGVDFSETAVDGAKDNAWFYRFEKLITVDNADFIEWHGGRYAAIVTDLPYGKASSTQGRKIEALYKATFEKMRKHSKRVVVMAAEDSSQQLDAAGWTVEQRFKLHEHKNLMRHIHICSARA